MISQVFEQIENIYDSNEYLVKKHNSAHTVFWFDNQAISYLKKAKTKIVIGFHKGYLLGDKFDFEPTCSKKIRHLSFSVINKEDKKLINEIIEQSIICSIELEENKKLKQHLKGKNE